MYGEQASSLHPKKARKVEMANGSGYHKVASALEMCTESESCTASLISNMALIILLQCIAVVLRHSESPLAPQFDKFLQRVLRIHFGCLLLGEKVLIDNVLFLRASEFPCASQLVKFLCRCWRPPFLLLPPAAVESMCRHLTDIDLLQLRQVNKHCLEVYSRDGLWQRIADKQGIEKSIEARSWKWNSLRASAQRLMTFRKLDLYEPAYVDGDVIFIDPLKIFFKGKRDGVWFRQLQDWVRPYLEMESRCLLTYHGFPVICATCSDWDSDLAFEITRNGESLGLDAAPSQVIAVVPKKLVDILMDENDSQLDHDIGVTVQGVKGVFESSRDGDFKIRDTSVDPSVASNASVICQTGGSWTTCGETSSDEDIAEEDDVEADSGLED